MENLQTRHKSQSGFSLIEVLVSLVILAIGLLGTGSLMMTTLRSNQTAGYSSIAARLASELQEIMSLNTDVVTDTGNGSSVFSSIDTTSGYTNTNASTCLGAGATCTPAQLYAFMVNDWILRVQSQLPGGMVKVCRDASPKDANGLYRWQCTLASGQTTGMLTVKLGWSVKNDRGETTFQQSGSDANPPRLVVTLYGSQQDIVSCPTGQTLC